LIKHQSILIKYICNTWQKRLMKKNVTTFKFYFLFLAALVFWPVEYVFSQVTFSGNYKNYNAITTFDGEILTGRNRLNLELSKPFSKGILTVTALSDNTYSEDIDDVDFRLKEAYADLYFANTDIRLGAQFINQGISNGFFLTDIINPLDVSEFLTQDIEDIRIGQPALNITTYFGSNFLQVVVSPVFSSYEFPKPGSSFFPFKNINRDAPVPIVFPDSLQQQTETKFQGSLRYAFRSNINYDFDIYAMYWSSPEPVFNKELSIGTLENPIIPQAIIEFTQQYGQSLILGFSGTLNAGENLVLRTESVFYTDKMFDYLPQNLRNIASENLTLPRITEALLTFQQNEDGFIKERPFYSGLIAVQTNFLGWTVENQWLTEHIFNHDRDLFREETFYSTTLLLQRQFLRNKLNVQTFGRYNFNGNDFWVNPQLTYEIDDGIDSDLGFQLFGGEMPDRFYGHFSFKNFAPLSFAYLRLSVFF